MNQKSISEQMLECLIRLKQNDIILCIATGRPPASVPHFPGIEFDAFLTFNASYCFTKDAVILSNPIPSSDVHQIIKNASEIHGPVALAGTAQIGSNGTDDALVEYFAIFKQAIAFGDGSNDIEMLEAVGTGVATGNATDDVKKAAAVICGSAANDGIYHYCLDHYLI